MHVNTGDPAGYEQRYPELMIVGYACRLCHECAPELDEGDRVVIRGTETTGHVKRIATCAGGFKLYRVQLEAGTAEAYPRNQLTKLPA